MIKNCFICNKEFYTCPSKIKTGRGTFCSHKCYWIALKTIMKGEGNHFYGKKHSKEIIDRIRKSKIGIPHSEEMKSKRKSRAGNKSSSWKGGRYLTRGYVWIYAPNHSKTKNHVQEHRLVIENIIGRRLLPTEEVNHLDRVKTNNQPSNLIAFTSKSAHMRFHWDPETVRPEEIIFDGRKHGIL